MNSLIRVGGLALSVLISDAALAFGPSIGNSADIGQLNVGLYDSDPASNAPNAGGIWTDFVGSNFTAPPRTGVHVRGGVARTPGVKITVGP
jgi:hypothetical protein